MKSRRAARGPARPEASAARPAAPVVFGWIAVVVAAIAAILAHARHLFPFSVDDTFVQLRYADRLLHGRGLTWTDGERIEGYASLLWVLSSSALGTLGVDLVQATWVLGIGSTLAIVVALLRRHSELGPADLVPGAFAALAIAVSGPVAAWSIGGMEAMLSAALLAWTLALLLPQLDRDARTARDLAPAGLLLALLVLTRLEGVFLGIAVAGGWWLARRRARESAVLLAWPFAAFAGHTLFRLVYHGAWLPSRPPALVEFGARRLLGGAIYVVDGLTTFAPVVLVAVVAGLWVWKLRAGTAAPETGSGPRGATRFLLVVLGVWLACVIAMGGDDLPARRLLIPALVVLVFLAGGALSRARSLGAGGAGLTILAGIALVIYAPLQLLDPAMRRTRTESAWLAEAQDLGRMLGQGFRAMRPRLAVDQPGALAFYSRLPAIDMTGLNDRALASAGSTLAREPRDGRAGESVLAREPDLIVFCSPAGGDTACFRAGLEMQADARFRQRYAIVNFRTAEPLKVHSRIWVRRDAGPLAIERSPGRIEIPGWHIDADPASTVRLDELGGAGVTIQPHRVTGVTALPLDPGVWGITLEANLPGVIIWVRDSASGQVLAEGPDRVGIRHPGGAVDIALQIQGDVPVIVRRMILERVR